MKNNQMTKRFLLLYLKISGTRHLLKDKLVSSINLLFLLFYSLVFIVFEIFALLISLPIFLFVSPDKVQEVGFIFPQKQIQNGELSGHYKAKRKISLITLFSTGGLFILKFALVFVISFFLIGGQTLLALTEAWELDVAENYTYDSDKIELVDGAAQLKNLTEPISGALENSSFDTDASSWTGVPTWRTVVGYTNTTNYISDGGNLGGYIDINLSGKKNRSSAGYWYQSFVIDSTNTSASLSFDWSVLDLVGTASEYNLTAYIGTASTAPLPAEVVWTSGKLSSISSWTGTGEIDISSFVTTPDTYYLKIAALETCEGGDCTTISGFDNVNLNWTSTGDPSFATSSPSIEPISSLNPAFVVSWDSFTTVSTKNGGEIYYQLSDDDGLTWQYWDGAVWSLASSTDYSTANEINAQIDSFPADNNQIKWRAFLSGDGTQQVILDSVSITYTEDDLPDIENINATQATSTPSLVLINYDIVDNEADPVDLVVYEYSLTGDFSGEELTMTASKTHLEHDGVLSLTSSSTPVTNTFVWDAETDLAGVSSDLVYVRLRANDGISGGPYAISDVFSVDFDAPSGLANLAKFSQTSDSVILSWDAAVDANFASYSIWYGADASAVENRTASSTEWSVADDANLAEASTVSTSINISQVNDYYAGIWALDIYGHEATIPVIMVTKYVEPEPEPEPVSSGGGGGGAVALMTDTTPPDVPVLSAIVSPTNLSDITISGLAEPRSLIEIFDNGESLLTLDSVTPSNGSFSQTINLAEGEHVLQARATDFEGNESELSNELILIIDQTAPEVPVVTNYADGDSIVGSSLELLGTAEASSKIEIEHLSGAYSVEVDPLGNWQFTFPNSLVTGNNNFILRVIDQAGNVSPNISLTLNKEESVIIPEVVEEVIPPVETEVPPVVTPETAQEILPGIPVTPPVETTEVVEITPEEAQAITPLPTETEISEVVEAVETVTVPAPRTTQILSERDNNVFHFVGTAEPNSDVAVYIHSDEGVIYRTRSDEEGIWNVTHSQDDIELTPGEHSVFAVVIDTDAAVKSQPSVVNKFMVEKNWFVVFYQSLNLYTTLLVLIITLFVILWLYQFRKNNI